VASEGLNRALGDLVQLKLDGHIDDSMVAFAASVIQRVFDSTTVYSSVTPDDQGVIFYWTAGDYGLTLELWPPDCIYCSVTSPGDFQSWDKMPPGFIPEEFVDSLHEFSAMVQRENPRWREQKR